ncbi:MAG: hypothetical protein Q3M24_17710 [Candidatus Electrothrix aestuarii]|uniref:Uncharacterized protein n=1 Tax=Candidatus Electrothrix aestuarii TaxID=3062594 RepID=A0AAU8LSK2_9BACT|nr:hypothetical protein [Candidatus Electrothrix aestuarii]
MNSNHSETDVDPGKEKAVTDNDESGETREEYFIPPREICESCLKESFFGMQKQELISIAKSRIPEVGNAIEKHHTLSEIFTDILDYYQVNNNFDRFWEIIKEKRENQWKKFHTEWEKSVEEQEKLVKSTERKDNISYRRQTIDIEKQQFSQTDSASIVDWFFSLDSSAMQSMVITAALFQGVERNTFNELTQDINKLFFPHEQDVQKNEPSLDENEKDSEKKEEKEAPPPILKNEFEHFHMARLKLIADKRNSDYGLADIEVVIFEYSNYQTEILKLIRNNLYSKQTALFEFIGSLVDDDSSEKRLFAINAVIALSETHLFQDLLDRIIRIWARTKNYYTHQAAALALSEILLQGRLEKEILALLNSWLKTGTSMFLNITSMFTYYLIADKYPDQALQAVAHVSEKEDIIFTLKSHDIVFKVYQNDRSTFISNLYNWIKDDRKLLRYQAGIYFFRYIDLADAVTDQASREKTVAIIFNLWEKPNMPMHPEVQGETTSKVESWAKEALVVWENDDFEAFESYRKFFHDLYQNYEEECQQNKTCRVNRLEYHLQRWEKRRIWELKRAEKRGISNNKQSSFDMLRPESVQL